MGPNSRRQLERKEGKKSLRLGLAITQSVFDPTRLHHRGKIQGLLTRLSLLPMRQMSQAKSKIRCFPTSRAPYAQQSEELLPYNEEYGYLK